MNNKIEDKYMIGLGITEQDYRDLPYPSYSLLSDIAKNGIEVVDGIRNPDIQEIQGVMTGRLVDGLYIENKLPDNLHIVNKKPTGKAKEILKAFARNIGKMPNKNLFHKDNEEILSKTCAKVGYHKASKKYNFDDNHPDLVKKRLDGLKNYKEYFNLLLTIDDVENSFIVTKYIYDNALKIVKALKGHIDLNSLSSQGIDIIPQVQIVGEVRGIKIKGMLDFIMVNHKEKSIMPMDLKTGAYKESEFIEKGFYGWNYYLQAALYLELLKQEMDKHPIYKDYELADFGFIFCGSDEKKPQSYSVSVDVLKHLLFDFKCSTLETDKRGLYDLIDEYKEYKGIM